MKKIIKSLFIIAAFCLFFGINRPAAAAAAQTNTLSLNGGWSSINSVSDSITHKLYRIELPGDGKLTVTLQSWINCTGYKVFDEDLIETFESGMLSKGTVNEPCSKKIADLYLQKGTYFVEIFKYTGYTGYSYTNTGDYRLKAEFVNGNTNESEPNNTAAGATTLTVGKTYRSLMWENDDYDYYKLTLSSPQMVRLAVKSWMNHITLGIRDAEYMAATDVNGKAISDLNLSKGTESEPLSRVVEYQLGKGTWYIFFRKYTGYTGYSYTNTGIYSIQWMSSNVKVTGLMVSGSTKIVRGKKATWKGTVTPTNATNKALKWASANTKIAKVSSSGVVTAVKPGKTTITATAKGGSGVKVSRTVIVLPKKMATPKSVTTKKSGSTVTKRITWTKQSYVSGYQVQYGPTKTYSKAAKKFVASSKNALSLSKKASSKYYVRVRAFVSIGGTKYYGAWSAFKTVK